MQACGHSPTRIFMPLIVIGIVFASLSFVVSDVLLPAGNIAFNRLYRHLLFGNVSLALHPNSTERVEDTVIVTGDEDVTHLRDVVIIDRDDQLDRRIIVAEQLYVDDLNRRVDVVTLSLSSVFIHTVDHEVAGDYDYAYAQTMEYNILLRNLIDGHTNLSPFEQSSIDLWHTIAEKRALLIRDRLRLAMIGNLSNYGLLLQIEAAERRVLRASTTERGIVLRRERERLHAELYASETSLDDYDLRNDLFEFHRRFAMAFAAFVFSLFACRVTVVMPRGGRVVALLIGVAVAGVYWLMFVAAQRVTLYSMFFSPALMAWTPNLVVILLTLFSSFRKQMRWATLVLIRLVTSFRSRDRTPVGANEKGAIAIGKCCCKE